jgi:NTP pyrophosphatase (non-canonical NTP hydrolase)
VQLSEYQEESRRTVPDDMNDMLGMAILGCCGEAGELAEIIKKARYQGHVLDIADVANELGDLLWYVARVADAIYTDLDAVADFNLMKLRQRYPDGFEVAKSVER